MATDAETKLIDKKRERIIGASFLAFVGGAAMIAGFSKTLMAAKKRDPKFFDKGVTPTLEMSETGAQLALRALGWGTLYAFLGTGIFCYGVWKLSGAKDFEEFRQVVGSKLPKIKKNDPPQSRTEFSGLNDLMGYLAEWGKSKDKPEIVESPTKKID